MTVCVKIWVVFTSQSSWLSVFPSSAMLGISAHNDFPVLCQCAEMQHKHCKRASVKEHTVYAVIHTVCGMQNTSENPIKTSTISHVK